MNCFFCKSKEMVEAKTTEVFEYGGNLIIVRNIPCLECEQCGEKYLIDSVMEQLENLSNEAKNIIQDVSIIDFAKVA